MPQCTVGEKKLPKFIFDATLRLLHKTKIVVKKTNFINKFKCKKIK